MDQIMATVNALMPHIAMPLGLLLLVCVAVHSRYMLQGWKPALTMIGIGAVVAYGLEEFGVHTGILYGRYYFTSMMGPKLDVIPVALVCAWVVLLYIAWNVSNLLLDQSPVPSSYSTGHIFFSAAVTALLVTTFDLNADPFAVANG